MRAFKLIIAIAGLLCFATDLNSQSAFPERNNPLIKVHTVVPVKAWAFNLHDVRLLPGSPFKNAQDVDGGYMLSLQPGRLLYRFYQNAGLPVTDSIYGGWESMGLSGHTLGHYVSACAMMYASTGDARFKERVDFIVTELGKCQDARKTGYVGAIPQEDSIFYRVQRGDIKTGGFDLNGGWSPWYTVHKVMAGLTDAYLYCGNKQALSIVKKMADWTGTIVNPLSEEQRQKMLKCEWGGMNDVLAQVYTLTGEKKYLDLSYKFYDDFVMKPLATGEKDPVAGKHSNTNIPKAIGSARQYELAANETDEKIAKRLWEIIAEHHSYVTGGNGNYEYLGQPDQLNDAISDATAESCCAYNMLKLTGHLFSWQPSSKLGDYYERTLYNDILASQHPQTAMMLYFEPLRIGSRKQFSDSFNTFTCCVGSGMENHTKYTDNIYFEGRDGSLYVNLFIPSELNWKSKQVKVKQETSFPEEGTTRIKFQTAKPASFVVKIRKPYWASGYSLQVNGAGYKSETNDEGFILVKRTWKSNDVISVHFDMSLHAESMPDSKDRIALLYGPLVLAGNLGDSMPDPVYGTPVLLTDNHNVQQWASPVNGKPLTFQMKNVGKPFDVELTPFYKNTDNYYSVYWDYFTNEKWNERQAEYAAEKQRQHEIEMRTVDVFRIGEMQPERDHNLEASEQSYVSDAFGRTGREARKENYFSFDMKVDSSTQSLLCTYIGDDNDRKFDILVDNVKIATVTLMKKTAGKFYDETYSIPAELLNGKSKLRVKITANYGKTAGRLFGCRTIR